MLSTLTGTYASAVDLLASPESFLVKLNKLHNTEYTHTHTPTHMYKFHV